MVDVDTLFVISSARGAYALDDIVSGIEMFNPSGSYLIVIVDEVGQITAIGSERCRLVHADPAQELQPGFKRAQGLLWAIEQGVAYKQVIMLDDSCLVRGGPLGDFWLEQLQDGVGVIGVGDTLGRQRAWSLSTDLFYEWQLPHQAFERPPIALADAFLVLHPQFVGVLYQKNLLLPAGADRWCTSYGAYISWVAQMLNFYVVAWGYTNKTLPPLFVWPADTTVPAPQIIADRFMIFSPVGSVSGYSESDIRELFKRQRGEPSREIPPFKPVTYGPGNSQS